ncbi:MAG TPA: hypothetical protein VJ785_13830 [Anaerolineales bacterium]|nr:hypothetical protein [Anaerolineales bacterium]
MNAARVWILFEPRIYSDLITRYFQSFKWVEVVIAETYVKPSVENLQTIEDAIDVIILPLTDPGTPAIHLLPADFQNSKIIAFSPSGDCGLLRFPGDVIWRRIVPFGLKQLVAEVYNSSWTRQQEGALPPD